MKRVVIAGIAAALFFTGCANIQKGIDSVANAIPSPDQVFKSSKQEDNFEVTIKDYDDTHYKLDVLFAMPNANSKEEAIEQYMELFRKADPFFKKLSARILLNKTYNYNEYKYGYGQRCRIFRVWIDKDAKLPVYHLNDFEGKNAQCFQRRVNFKDVFVELKPVNIDGTYYLVVNDTNVKNRSLGSKFMMIIASGGSEKAMDEVFKDNDYLMEFINLSFFEAIKRDEELRENFVNLQTGDKHNLKDDRADFYRKKFMAGLQK